MSRDATTAGADAYGRGLSRDKNPFDASDEDWMCWRDGWEQAKAADNRAMAAVPPAVENSPPAP